jgi:FkbH-like protein
MSNFLENRIETAMQRISAQPILFSPKVSRLALRQLPLHSDGRHSVTVNVWRNHAIEPVLTLAEPYFDFARWRPEIRLSSYDDSLLFAEHRQADVELLWLDSSRYSRGGNVSDSWCDWLMSRIAALRSATTAPIILATWIDDADWRERLQQYVDAIPAVYFADCDLACRDAGVTLLDTRSATMAGTPVGNAAQVVLARKLTCHWLPAAVVPPMKAVALDLDNTLHAGVLGEDGIEGVRLTPAHESLQHYVKSLRQRGIFIALVSRNEYQDVEALFARHHDYPLRREDFSAMEVSWNDKTSSLLRIAEKLRIAPNAILFIDDNPGELAHVAEQLPQAHTLHALPDASLTQCALEHYPGLWRWKQDADDHRRVQDLQTNAEREALFSESANAIDYFQSLQAVLTYRRDPTHQLNRIADLCVKTNQFNLAMRRLNQVEIAERMQSADACVVSVQMKDRLSDSGVVAVIVARRHGGRLEIEELCVSCRALGRHLEDTLILEAIRDMPQFADCREIAFRVEHGPRNQPALDWLAGLLGGPATPSPGIHLVPAGRISEFTPADGVTLLKE